MPNLIDTFDSYSAGAGLPAGWASRWDGGTWSIIDVSGGKALQQVDTSAARRLATYDAVDSDATRDNVEILAELRTDSVFAANAHAGVGGRLSGSGSAENGYVVWIYGAELAINKYVSSTSTQIALTTTLSIAAMTRYMLRFRINGSSLKAKIWLATDSEPGAWNLDTTDTGISAAGWAGCNGFAYISGVPDDNHVFYRIAIATNGDTASFSDGAAALAGDAASAASATGALTTQIPLAGAALVVASSSADLSTGGAAALEGNAQAQAAATAQLTTQIPLSGAAAAVAIADGTLTAQITLSADALAQAFAEAGLTTGPGGLAADAIAQAAAAATLTAQIRLDAAAVAQAAASGGLLTGINLGGDAQAQATAGATLTAAIALSADAVALAIAAGGLTAQIRLSADALAQAFAEAGLTTAAGGLAADAGSMATATGALTAQIRMAGDAAATSVATATLTGMTALAIDPRFVARRQAITAARLASRRFTAKIQKREFKVAA